MPTIRLGYNPAKLTPYGMDRTLMVVGSLIYDGLPALIQNGRVTRFDIAADISGVTLSNVIVRSSRKKKHGVYSDAKGTPQTTYLGSPRRARLVAYTKFDTTTGEEFLRLETRLKPKVVITQLIALPNPFSEVELIDVAAFDDLDLGIPTQMLADCIRVRGLLRALRMLDATKRKRCLEALESAPSVLPASGLIWAQLPLALAKAGLGGKAGLVNMPAPAFA